MVNQFFFIKSDQKIAHQILATFQAAAKIVLYFISLIPEPDEFDAFCGDFLEVADRVAAPVEDAQALGEVEETRVPDLGHRFRVKELVDAERVG